MENGTSFDTNRMMIIEVLTRGEEQIKQLDAHLDDPSPSEFCRPLAKSLMSTLSTAIYMVKAICSEGSQPPACPYNTGSDSPASLSGSPPSESSDRPNFKDQEHREMSKKRYTKTLPKWRSQVRIGSGTGDESSPLDDGFNWRKYGQKEILGAKYPRGYYRCSHRNTRGCPATKQVQRSDTDPSVFDVTYRGRHICLPRQLLMMESAAPLQEPNMPRSKELVLAYGTGLPAAIKAQGLDSKDQVHSSSSSFSFPSTPVSCIKAESHGHFMGNFIPDAFKSTTSATESNYFSLVTNYGGSPSLSLQHESTSELTEIVSAATSAVNSPVVDMDFLLQQVDQLGSSFSFDDSNFFS